MVSKQSIPLKVLKVFFEELVFTLLGLILLVYSSFICKFFLLELGYGLMKNKLEFNKNPNSYKAFIASTFAGVISTTLTAPLWTLKTRLNLSVVHREEIRGLNVNIVMIIGSEIAR